MPTSRPDETKRLAQRIDITYHRRPTWFRLWRRWVMVLTFVGVGVLAACGVISMLHGGRAEQMLNPGHITQAHGHFENNCAACHDNGGKPGFSKTVSDTACLKCHTVSPHAKGANRFISSNAAHAANCVACHIEHRDRPTMAGRDDRLCSQCHGDLNSHIAKGHALPVGFDVQVKKFAVGDHPRFGRALVAAGVPLKMPAAPKPASQPWLANLQLKFNHASHMSPEKVKATLTCAACHVSVRPDPRSLRSGGSMLPISYEQNCRKCHPIVLEMSFKGGEVLKKGSVSIPLPHGSPRIVRGPLLDLPSAMREGLVSNHDQIDAALKVDGDAVGRTLKFMSEQLIEQVSDKVSTAYDTAAERIKKTEKIKEGSTHAAQLDGLGELAAKDPASIAEYLAFNKTTYTCSKCHVVEGDLELVYAMRLQWQAMGQAPKATAAPTRLHTVPTGIGQTPKRWFAASRFDHEAHRDQTCLSCHAGMDKDEDDPFARLPTIESCVACHRPDTPASRGAGTGCISCHAYHAR